jgi:hypothetical protein
VDGLSSGETRSPAVDLHLEVAVDDMDRLGLVVVSVGRQRPARREMVD